MEIAEKPVWALDYHSSVFFPVRSPERINFYYDLEFFYDTKGSCSYVNGSCYRHFPGAVLLVPAGSCRHSEGSFQCYGIHFHPSSLMLSRKLLPTETVYLPLPEAEELFRNLVYTSLATKKGYELFAYGTILQLLSLIAECEDTDVRRASLPPYAGEIRKACRLLRNTFRDTEVTMDQVCSQVAMGRSAFFAAFRAITGQTPTAYLIRLRMDHAKQLLVNTDLAIGSIASECGFSGQSYFASLFRKATGLTPRAYREEYRIKLQKYLS